MRLPSRLGRAFPALAMMACVTGCGSPSAAVPTSTVSVSAQNPTPSPTSTPAHMTTVGLVTDVGGLHDRSFNDMAYQGMKAAMQQPGVRGSVIESTDPSQYVANLTRFARAHTGLIVAVGCLMQSAIYQVAMRYPSRRFAIVDCRPADANGNPVNLSNVANVLFKEQESGYLVGMIAGLMEKNRVGKATHNIIGYMGGAAIPPVDRYFAGYVAGAKDVDPTIQVLGAYSESFGDENKGKAIGFSQISRGADILFQDAAASGTGYLTAAGQRGAYGIGADTNQSYLGPQVIASAVKRVDVAVRDIIRKGEIGRFSGGDHLYGLAQGGTGFMTSGTVVPARIIARVRAVEPAIASGKIRPPTVIPIR